MQRMHTHQTPPPAVSWRTHLSLALLALVYIFSFIDRQVLSILLEPVKQEFGASDTEMGLLTGLAFGLIYAMLGIGLNIVVGLAGLLDLGYVGFYAVGAYTYALLAEHAGWGFWQALPVASSMKR